MGEITKKWWEDLKYDDCLTGISIELGTMQRSFVSIGFYLRKIRDEELFREDDKEYENIWEFAKDKFNLSMSTASRWMSINEKFSEGGNSPLLAERFKEYGKSQLQEMLTMSDEQLDQVSPDMTKMQIRDIKKGFAESGRNTEQPPEHEPEHDPEQLPGQDCFMNHPELMPEAEPDEPEKPEEEQEEEPEEPFPSKIDCILEYVSLMIPPKFKNQMKMGLNREFNQWLLANKTIAYTETSSGWLHGTNTHLVFEDKYKYPLYKIPWFEVSRIITTEVYGVKNGVMNQAAPEQMTSHAAPAQEVEKVCGEVVDPEKEDASIEKTLSQYGLSKSVYPEDPLIGTAVKTEKTSFSRLTHQRNSGIKTGYWSPNNKDDLVERLAAYENTGLTPEEVKDLKPKKGLHFEMKQPDLPKFKNDSEREEWLRNYKEWRLWYHDDNIDVNYYKYDFPDGSRLVVSEYPDREAGHRIAPYTEHKMHFMEKNRESDDGYRKKRYDRKFCYDSDSMTYMKDWLKKHQREWE